MTIEINIISIAFTKYPVPTILELVRSIERYIIKNIFISEVKRLLIIWIRKSVNTILL